MKHLDKTVLVNRWTARTGANGGSVFVHRIDIVDGESINTNGNITIDYIGHPKDENGDRLRGYWNEYSMSAEQVERFPVHDEPEGLEVDKDRPSFEGRCPSCRTEAELFLLKSDPIEHARRLSDLGEWECKNCAYTFWRESMEGFPVWLEDKIQNYVNGIDAPAHSGEDRVAEWWYRAYGPDY